MNDMIAIYALVALLSVPLGIYIAFALSTQTNRLDTLFGVIEKPIYRLAGVNSQHTMTWQVYALAILKLHVGLILLAWLVFMCQASPACRGTRRCIQRCRSLPTLTSSTTLAKRSFRI